MKKMKVIYFCLMVNKQQLNVLSVPKHYTFVTCCVEQLIVHVNYLQHSLLL